MVASFCRRSKPCSCCLSFFFTARTGGENGNGFCGNCALETGAFSIPRPRPPARTLLIMQRLAGRLTDASAEVDGSMQWTPLMAAGAGAFFVALVVAIVFQPHLAALLLPVLALYAALSLRPQTRRWPFSWRAVWVLPSIFALYVLLSALWGSDARSALVAGALFGIYLICARVVFVGVLEAEMSVIERLGSYFVAAVATGAVLLAITIYSHGALHKAICAVFPALAPTDRDWVRLDSTGLEFVGLPYFNRNVALLNLLLWPALLVLAKRVVDWRTALVPIGLIVLVAAATFGSDHQTSWMALGAGGLTLVLYRLSPR